jgi:hypothetical protein
MTRPDPGTLFVISGRVYIDSQTLHNLAATHTVLPRHGGYRVLVPGGGAMVCETTEGRPPLPRQRGALYEVRAEGGARGSHACATWLSSQAAELAGRFTTWPGKPACACGPTCGCAPCRDKHHDHT